MKFFELITVIFATSFCLFFGILTSLGIYTFIQDLKLIDNNLATDVTAIIISYIFFRLSWSPIKNYLNSKIRERT